MRKIKKGSFTIEAALLMPLVLMILIGVLYLDFFVHDRAYLTAAAYEAAVSGSMEGYRAAGMRESEHADKCRKNCESNLQTGSTCRVPGAEMEAGSQW